MLTEAEKGAILGLSDKGMKPKTIAAQLGYSKGTIAGVLYRHKLQSLLSTVPAKSLIPPPVVVKRAENDYSDFPQWQSELKKLWRENDYIRVMHLNDLHLPYYDAQALSAFCEIAKRFMPQIVVLGSDMHDFPTLSRFEADPEIGVDDWQERAREYYYPLINRLNTLLPNALMVWIYGNHDRRALKAIKESDNPKTGMAYFMETVRANGRVLHSGHTEHVEIGKLIVAHGDKANKYAAASIGAQWPNHVVNFGHVHRYQAIGNAWSNGALCQMIPHYSDFQYPNSWNQGTSTMLASKNNVMWEYHHFIKSGNKMFTKFGNELIEVR